MGLDLGLELVNLVLPDCGAVSKSGLTEGRREAGHHGFGKLPVRHIPGADGAGVVLDHEVRVGGGVRLGKRLATAVQYQ